MPIRNPIALDAILFDLFGTLVDEFPLSTGKLHTEFVQALDVPYEPFMKLWRQTTDMRVIGAFQSVEESIRHVCNELGIVLPAAAMTRAVELRLQMIRRALTPKADAGETLEKLRDAGYKTGLLSNCSIEIPILWPETAFAHLMDAAVFSSRDCLKKPDPRIFQLACERLGIPPERCLYVADGENYELSAAAKLGLHPVLIRNASQDISRELHREAREWRGRSITALGELLALVSVFHDR